jgi:hypothetical protein
MAYSASNLKKVAGGSTSIFYYDTADAIGDVVASGYFNNATPEVKQHDIIICVSSTAGSQVVDVLVVTSATGATTVTTANGT